MQDFWEVAVKAAGIGAVGCFVIWSLYKRWLTLPIFTILTQIQTFVLMFTFLILVFAVTFLALTPNLLGSDPKPIVTSQVQQLDFYVRQGRDDSKVTKWAMVENGTPRNPVPLIRTGDDLKIVGKLSAASHWALIWLDSRGAPTIVARSNRPEEHVNYPKNSDFVSVNQADPPGTHALVLLRLNGATSPAELALINNLQGTRAPQNILATTDPRGPGEISPSDTVLSFPETVSKRLPDGAALLSAALFSTNAGVISTPRPN